MQIDSRILKSFRMDFAKSVADLEKQYGIKLSLGTIRYDSHTFSTKLKGTAQDGHKTGEPVKPQIELDFERYCRDYNLMPTDLGKKFSHNGTTYTLSGLKPRSYKFPFIGIGPQGGRYKFPTSIATKLR